MRLKLLNSPDDPSMKMRGQNLWYCQTEDGWCHAIDFFVADEELAEKLQVGMMVEVNFLQPYVEIAHGPIEIVEE